MNKSWNIGKIAGIDLKLHPTFLFLLLWVGFTGVINRSAPTTIALDIMFILALFLCVVLHETGHALMARRFGIRTQDITLLPIGGVARLERMPEDPKEELWVAAAGPTVNLVISGILLVGLVLSGFFAQPFDLSVMLNNFWLRLLSANLTLVAFNLIPAFPMDGGRVLRALFATRMDHVKATRWAANIGKGFAVLMGIAGFFVNPWLILTALFVWSGAATESRSVAVKAGLEGLTVQDAMISQFHQVEANQPLGQVFDLSMQTGQQNIPVTSNGHFLGIVRRQDLTQAIERLGNRAPAYAAIGVEPEHLKLDLPLQEVVQKFSQSRVLPVVEDGQLIGMVTPESVQQRMWLNQRRPDEDPRPPEEKTTPV